MKEFSADKESAINVTSDVFPNDFASKQTDSAKGSVATKTFSKMKFIIFSFEIGRELNEWANGGFVSRKTMKNIFAILEKPIKQFCRPVEAEE